MKRLLCILILCPLIFSLSACSEMSVSTKMYNEICDYVTENKETLSPTSEIEFYDYKATGLSIGGVYYGYYYTADNDIEVPDFYLGGNLGERYEADDGTYFGKPNNGTDWCFIKKITDKWYYYELHWA